jgi:hypothetical protein
MKQKYVLHPGIVTTAPEGKCYFVSASTLAYLYGIELKECRIADPSDPAQPEGGNTPEIHIYPGLEDREGRPSLIITIVSPEDEAIERAE